MPRANYNRGIDNWGVSESVRARAARLATNPTVKQPDPTHYQARISPDGHELTLRPSPRLAREMGSLTLDGFAINSATLNNEHIFRLQELAESIQLLLRSYPGGFVKVVGHTDATGTEIHNQGLGYRRAEAVRDSLIGAGAPAAMIDTSSSGETAPRVITQRPEARNRRVEIQFQPQLTTARLTPPLRFKSPDPRGTERTSPMLYPPLRPESETERFQRSLVAPQPSPVERLSFNAKLWKLIDSELNSLMGKLNIPEPARPLIRDGAHAAIDKGLDEILDKALSQVRISGKEKEALKALVHRWRDEPDL